MQISLLIQMVQNDSALDDFIDDCFIEDDPLCCNRKERSLDLIASQLISEIVTQENDELIAS